MMTSGGRDVVLGAVTVGGLTWRMKGAAGRGDGGVCRMVGVVELGRMTGGCGAAYVTTDGRCTVRMMGKGDGGSCATAGGGGGGVGATARGGGGVKWMGGVGGLYATGGGGAVRRGIGGVGVDLTTAGCGRVGGTIVGDGAVRVRPGGSSAGVAGKALRNACGCFSVGSSSMAR